ncbi:MAG TPA: nicotinamide-nucleotide amidase [Burkholderiales bacterium]|jgi:nicotinamide-nucleotide amidase|nr:nicotinamide-nucleotide amidase [Burkholderiales bacterium]
MDQEIYQLSQRLGTALKQSGMVLATAESCTGGWISQAITMIPGSSGWFDCGFVTYTNRSKQALLGVQASTLARHGAVSELTVREMAEGALARTQADYSVAVSGVAGPDGGSSDKPVGTVWLAVSARERATRATRLHLSGDRDAVRRQTVIAALKALTSLTETPLIT